MKEISVIAFVIFLTISIVLPWIVRLNNWFLPEQPSLAIKITALLLLNFITLVLVGIVACAIWYVMNHFGENEEGVNP